MSDRDRRLERWLDGLGYRGYRLAPASADASFRRYLRLEAGGETRIVMDAPPAQEPCAPFVEIAAKLRAAGLSAPRIDAADLEQGFLLLEDFGDTPYLAALTPATEAALYGDALAALATMQTRIGGEDLPAYDAAMLATECDLFRDWFLLRLLGIDLDAGARALWREARSRLVESALAQPVVFVHRDYHSRNLMVLARGNPGILDFQGAVRGPLCYDLVSLLRDCYIAWPPARVERLALDYLATARAAGLTSTAPAPFLRWFDRMGAQRHLKAIGIFARLKLRDGKDGYIGDIPRTFGYLRAVTERDVGLAALSTLFERVGLGARVARLAAA